MIVTLGCDLSSILPWRVLSFGLLDVLLGGGRGLALVLGWPVALGTEWRRDMLFVVFADSLPHVLVDLESTFLGGLEH